MASALRTSAEDGKREELCHTLHKDGRRALTQACFHEHPERHKHRRLKDQGVPVLHVEPMDTRLRQLRVVIQEFEQDDLQVVPPRPEPQHVDTSETKAQIWAKRTSEPSHKTKKL